MCEEMKAIEHEGRFTSTDFANLSDCELIAEAEKLLDDRQIEDEGKLENDREAKGAAVAAAVAGSLLVGAMIPAEMILAGPLLVAAAYSGGFHLAAKNDGTTGDIARASGSFVADTGHHIKSLLNHN